MDKLTSELIDVEKLIPYSNNARTHSNEQIEKISISIKEFGFLNPILIDESFNIIAGHGRVEASKHLGIKEVPCVFITHLSDEQKRAYIIADNKLAEDAGWDEELLMLELCDLHSLDFDIELTGFTLEDFNNFDVLEDIVEDDFDGQLSKETKIKQGDIYALGNHILMCGDSTKEKDIAKLMNGQLADLYVTDPPYNVNYEGNTGLKILNDDMDKDSFKKFLVDAFTEADKVLKAGGAFYIWHADVEGYNFRAACNDIGWQIRQCLIWNKSSLVLGRQDYQSKHEPCLYGWKTGDSHYFIHDRTQTTIYDDTIDIESLKKDELKEMLLKIFDEDVNPSTIINEEKPKRNEGHPTMKPIKLLARNIKNSSIEGSIVLDSFGGSGSTLIACEQLGRSCRMMELEPEYVDLIIRRWEEFTGKKAKKIV